MPLSNNKTIAPRLNKVYRAAYRWETGVYNKYKRRSYSIYYLG